MKSTLPSALSLSPRLFALAAFAVAAALSPAQEIQQNFDGADALAKWEIRGDVKFHKPLLNIPGIEVLVFQQDDSHVFHTSGEAGKNF